MERHNERILSVGGDLKGMPVIDVDTGAKLGEVTDAILHPTEGRFLGLAIRTTKRGDRAVPAELLMIGVDAVMARVFAGEVRDESVRELKRGVLARDELVGTNVVTDDGTLLGRVSEVYLTADARASALRVVESELQRLFGGGFYVPGGVPLSYSPDGLRMVVPTETRDRLGAESPEAALGQSASPRTDS